MDEKERSENTPPPQSIIIQSSDPANLDNTKKFLSFPGSEEHYGDNQVVIPVDGKPSNILIVISLLIIFISTGGFLFSIDSGLNIDDDFLCCLLCNGNAIGLVMLGVFNTQYGRWKGDMGWKISSRSSYVVAGLFFILSIVFITLWLIYFTSPM